MFPSDVFKIITKPYFSGFLLPPNPASLFGCTASHRVTNRYFFFNIENNQKYFQYVSNIFMLYFGMITLTEENKRRG